MQAKNAGRDSALALVTLNAQFYYRCAQTSMFLCSYWLNTSGPTSESINTCHTITKANTTYQARFCTILRMMAVIRTREGHTPSKQDAWRVRDRATAAQCDRRVR